MLNSFPNVRIGLMVGIGGGVPSEEHDVRLGDVVVSASRDGYGGVFQYDFGKSIQGQGFQNTRFLNQPPTSLRTAMIGIQTEYEINGHRLEEAINNILDKNARLRRKYERPEPITDRLFQPESVHNSICGDVFCAYDSTYSVPRKRADRARG
ncbi:nucleoside phosphorylase domain-containing protein [Penicillium maclennaniae]|uniref:nucleoside phosphorylase domain-containing protein n=1 Tax=Penicillium maclennaniae TaxID=1343394 RepID=UPI0025412407|nr:nucleoside phosphorylase domain-containing protein [Penicillium maclennaniae]KAJ5661453.1 nucleoside phosphorylase domain-containing protein [Penicillium maclennaniae]